MARPADLLIELAAGRTPAPTTLSDALIDSAVEHRMWGLLHTWAEQAGVLSGEFGERLAGIDAQQWARNRLLCATASKVSRTADSLGLPIAFIKGVTLEAQVYTRLGERPTTDLDIVVAPGYAGKLAEFVAALHPDHRWLQDLEELITRGGIQSIDLVTDGIPVDVHVDPLKLEIVGSRHPHLVWERLTSVAPVDEILPCLDAEAGLAMAIVHLNKDRFRYLIGYADIVRLMARVEDWSWIDGVARVEGLETPMRATLDVVTRRLGVASPWAGPARGSRYLMWRVLWPGRIRLIGAPGRVRYRYRQMFIPLTGTGRVPEVARGWFKRVFPPQVLLDAYYPHGKGPYLWKMLTSRVLRRQARRRQRRHTVAVDHDGSPPSERRT